MRIILVALIALCVSVPAQADTRWRITKDHWTAADEVGFGKFVQAIGDTNCSSSESCMRNAANPYRDSDPRGMDIDSDCAKFPYFLRAYYAWKNGLPFGFVNGVTGSGGDIRFSKNGNRATSRFAFIDHGNGIDGPAAMHAVMNSVSSATYRQAADDDKGVIPDYYSPQISPTSIRPGTVIYDVNGHATIVYRVDPDGRVHYMGASPDFSISRDVYGAQFGQPPAKLGGGFKNFRPLTLVGAHRDGEGHLIGGHIELARNSEIPDFSLAQYEGTDGKATDPVKAHFVYDGVDLDYFEYVRAAVAGGAMSYNPIYEFKTSLNDLCQEFVERGQSIDQAISEGLENKPHPGRLPDNIYAASDTTWENYATPKRDARIKAIFAQTYKDFDEMLKLWTNRDPRIVYDGIDLKSDLQKVYNETTAKCSVTYLSSDKEPVTLTFDQLVHNLYAMSFDPYDCIEHRWGDDRSSCPDSGDKLNWYKAEQVLRDKIEPDSTAQMGYSLAELENHGGRPRAQLADLDVKSLIDDMGAQVAFAGMTPVGR